MYKLFFKRFFDFILSLIAIIMLSPVYLIVIVLVRIKLGSPVFFTQKRPGKDEKILFEKATCVDMEISYIRQGKSYIATKLTVQAQKLAFGTEEFENQWVNIPG